MFQVEKRNVALRRVTYHTEVVQTRRGHRTHGYVLTDDAEEHLRHVLDKFLEIKTCIT